MSVKALKDRSIHPIIIGLTKIFSTNVFSVFTSDSWLLFIRRHRPVHLPSLPNGEVPFPSIGIRGSSLSASVEKIVDIAAKTFCTAKKVTLL